jgi:hypothetical protein
MRTEVTEQGLLIPLQFLVSIKEVEIRKENGLILVIPAPAEDPILQLGRDPVITSGFDASVNHDQYIYQP